MRSLFPLRLGIIAFATMLGLAAAPANASLILSTGLVGGSGNVDNVIFNTCGLGSSSGTTVQGCLNSSHTTLVDFTSNETLNIGGGGQAVISATDGNFDYFKITMDDPTLGIGKLQFSLNAVANGSATFKAIDQFGNVFNFGSFALSSGGQNFFTLYSLDNEVAVSFELMSTVGIQDITDLEHVRIGASGVGQGQGVPEPMSLALVALGLFFLTALRRKLRR